jgi:cysteine desulfurase
MAKNRAIYLDHAAATPIDAVVVKAMEPYYSDYFYNPSATYLAAKRVSEDLKTARNLIAHHLGAKPNEIIFVAGASEANNLAIHGIMSNFPQANLITSAIEHESVLMPASKHTHKVVSVKPDGRIDLDDLISKIDDNTVLVSVMQANNEVGTLQPLKEVAEVIRSKRLSRKNDLPLYLHTDATQAANYLDLHCSRLGVDLMSLNGGKIYGPKQSGCLYVKAGVSIAPLIDGGGQEKALRSGTENVAGVIGFATALDIAQTSKKAELSRLSKLQKDFINLLSEIDGVKLNGSLKHRLPNNVHISLDGADNERLLIQLDEAGVQAAAGSACSASKEEPSHVLKAIGISDDEARSSIRFSMGRGTSLADINRCVDLLKTFYS